jgi:hypothetical protein
MVEPWTASTSQMRGLPDERLGRLENVALVELSANEAANDSTVYWSWAVTALKVSVEQEASLAIE